MLHCTMRGTSFAIPPGHSRLDRRNVDVNLSEHTWPATQGQQAATPASNQWVHHLYTGINRIRSALTTRLQRSRDAQALQTFTDRELWDLGLSRSDILRIEKGTFQRD